MVGSKEVLAKVAKTADSGYPSSTVVIHASFLNPRRVGGRNSQKVGTSPVTRSLDTPVRVCIPQGSATLAAKIGWTSNMPTNYDILLVHLI